MHEPSGLCLKIKFYLILRKLFAKNVIFGSFPALFAPRQTYVCNSKLQKSKKQVIIWVALIRFPKMFL